MIYVELQFDPDEAYIEHEKEVDNPLVIQALTRYKQNLAADFAEAFFNRGERLFICSQFLYELVQLGKNLEYRQVAFCNLARTMSRGEIGEALECMSKSCITLVDTALVAVAEYRDLLPLPATFLFLELPRADLDKEAAKVNALAKDVYYVVAWKSCGTGITADVAFHYNLKFDAEIKDAQLQKETLVVNWPFSWNSGAGYEDISYAVDVDPQQLLSDKFVRSPTRQFLKQLEIRIQEILQQPVKLHLRTMSSKTLLLFDKKNLDEDFDATNLTFEEFVREVVKRNDQQVLRLILPNNLRKEACGQDMDNPAPQYWKHDDNEAAPAGSEELDNDQDFFEKVMKFSRLQDSKEEKEEKVNTVEMTIEEYRHTESSNIVVYNKNKGQNLYAGIQVYASKYYDSHLELKEPGVELEYDWAGVHTDEVILQDKQSEAVVEKIWRAFRPARIIVIKE